MNRPTHAQTHEHVNSSNRRKRTLTPQDRQRLHRMPRSITKAGQEVGSGRMAPVTLTSHTNTAKTIEAREVRAVGTRENTRTLMTMTGTHEGRYPGVRRRVRSRPRHIERKWTSGAVCRERTATTSEARLERRRRRAHEGLSPVGRRRHEGRRRGTEVGARRARPGRREGRTSVTRVDDTKPQAVRRTEGARAASRAQHREGTRRRTQRRARWRLTQWAKKTTG